MEKFRICKNDRNIVDTILPFDTDSYSILINNDIIGYFKINNFFDFVSFDYELVEKYRNIGLGNEIFNLIENFVINSFDNDKILLLVKYDNDISRHIILKNNYNIDYNLLEEMSGIGEMTMYSPFVKVISKKLT